MMIKETDRLSIQYNNRSSEAHEHYSHMFTEDFYQNIVPISWSKSKLIECKLDPEDTEFESFLLNLLPTYKHHFRNEFNGIILEFINYISQHLILDGYMFLEHVIETDINDNKIHRLVNFYGNEISIKGNNIFQKINEDLTKQSKKSNTTIIPSEKCFFIEFPKSLGGKNKYLKFLKEFRKLGEQSPMMNFWNNDLSNQPGYDINKHQHYHDLELWSKSKIYHWHHRESHNKLFSDYYIFKRRLEFQKSRIILRDYIIEKLNEIIEKISTKLGKPTNLKIEGLVTLEIINKALVDWETGNFDINSIRDIL